MRLDFIFSYWILLWYLAYTIKFTDISPKFALIFGIIENFTMFGYMVYRGTPVNSLVRFGFSNFIIKAVPLYLLRGEHIRQIDVIMTLCVFVLYNAWLFINNETFTSVVSQITESLIHNKNNTPFMRLLANIENQIK